jgi:hypothetical protein
MLMFFVKKYDLSVWAGFTWIITGFRGGFFEHDCGPLFKEKSDCWFLRKDCFTEDALRLFTGYVVT